MSEGQGDRERDQVRDRRRDVYIRYEKPRGNRKSIGGAR